NTGPVLSSHITCRCRAEFFYECEAKWKTCPCEVWDKTRLVAQAEQRVANVENNPAGWRQQVQVDRNRRILQEIANLRANHECQHCGSWRYRHGGGRCEACAHPLPHCRFGCHKCGMLACNRCRKNRI